MIVWVGVAMLGGFGACARFLVDRAVAVRAFPLGTLVVNLSGAFLLGLLSDVTGDAYLLAGTATLGAYTTFSTWMLETHRLAEDGRGRPALLNMALSLAAGLLCAWLGRELGMAL
jgi:fluoride exporter